MSVELRGRWFLGYKRRLVTWLGVLGLGGIFLLAFVFLPRPVVRHDVGSQRYSQMSVPVRAKAVNDVRTSIIQAVGALAVGLAGVVAWRQLILNYEQTRDTSETTRVQLDLSRQTLIGERFTAAMDQLGVGVTPELRIGGIYGLELIAKASPEEEGIVAEVLCAFLRSNSALPGSDPRANDQSEEPGEPALGHSPSLETFPSDRQAALKVLGRLTGEDLSEDELMNRMNHNIFDLRGADLHGAELSLGRFDGVQFAHTDLSDANMSGGSFQGANFFLAVLADANLAGADLTGAWFSHADLRGADLSGAKLNGADMSDALVEEEQLRRALR